MQTTSAAASIASSATATSPPSAGTRRRRGDNADEPRPDRCPPETAEIGAIAGEIVALARENVRLLAAFARRFEVARLDADPDGRAVRCPADVVDYLRHEMADLAQEQLRAVLLDGKNRILGVELVYQGGQNAVHIRLSDCFRAAVRAGASAILLVHNHPSGNPDPSPSDIVLTGDAGRAGELLDIPLLDHVIIGRDSFASLRERGHFAPPDGVRVPRVAGS